MAVTSKDESVHVGSGWREAHDTLVGIAKRRGGLDAEEATWLLIARREQVHVPLGFGSFLEYLERTLGYRPRTAIERLRVAEELETLPATRELLAGGGISYSAVREMSRVAEPDTERAWLDAVANKTMREIERAVAGHKKGDLPDDPVDPNLEPRRLCLELDPEAYALFLQARRCLEEETGLSLDDSALIAAMCGRVLHGGGDAENGNDRAPYQIALTTCDRCQRTTQDAAGQVIDVGPEVLERARCDADHIGRVDAATPARVKSDIPPAIRRLVVQRDHRRCSVPGCRSSRGLQIHHIVLREHGGDHSLSNLTLLCEAHHHALHNGHLTITGTAPHHLRFAHADGRGYGEHAFAPPSSGVRNADRPATSANATTHVHVDEDPGEDVFVQATSALRNCGYPAAIANAAVERVRVHVDATSSLEDVIKAALRECPAISKRGFAPG